MVLTNSELIDMIYHESGLVPADQGEEGWYYTYIDADDNVYKLWVTDDLPPALGPLPDWRDTVKGAR